ncbi:MAG: hypothetical protein WD069_06245 [Planctomycetales bacterium]
MEKRRGLGCTGCFALVGIGVLLLVIVVMSSHRPQDRNAPTPAPVRVPVVVDLPSLVGKSIDELRGILGEPLDQQLEPTRVELEVLGVREWMNDFEIRAQDDDEQVLIVTFDPRSRRVLEFFLMGDDRNILMQRGNLVDGDPAYRIEAVKARNAPGITGINVVPR